MSETSPHMVGDLVLIHSQNDKSDSLSKSGKLMNIMQSKFMRMLMVLLMSLLATSCASLGSLAGNNSSDADEAAIATEELPQEAAVSGLSQETLIAAQPTGFGYERDVFRIGDTAIVDVFDFERLSGSHIVNRSGTILLPLVGTVEVAGLSTLQLQELLTDRYGADYLQNPSINVGIEAQSFGKIIVDGAVSKPGVFEIDTVIPFTEAIALAQGLDELAERDEIYVIRVVEGKRVIHTVDLAAIQTEGAADPAIIPSDYIFVKNSRNREVYNELLNAIPLLNTFAIIGRL